MKKKLQVFVSSTYTDLRQERQSAVSAILKAGHIPAGMELFTAGDQSQLKIINRWIDESDVYMLILGGRYGSIEPETGLSYTELEYNYALDNGKPLFAVVINEDALERKVKEFGTEVMEKEETKKYNLFRDKVLSNMSSFFDDEKDIRLCVLESLPEIAITRKLKGWVSGADVTDTKSLVDEISRLTNENNELNNKLLQVEEQVNKQPTDKVSNDFDVLAKLLEKIIIEFPGNTGTSVGINKTENLLRLIKLFKSNLIVGISSLHSSDDLTKFVFSQVCPRLQIHGLVKFDEKSTGRRRFIFTKKGEEFMAHLELTELL